MHHKSFLDVGSVKTHVACWGRWVEETTPDEVIICIPGNPGVAGFYYPYLEELYRNTKIPVWIIGHAGHEEPAIAGNNLPLAMIGGSQGREMLFNLQGQLDHKIDFLKRFTKPTTRVHLLGHSIGGWIALELLKNEVLTTRITSANLLFPTIQYMAETPKGMWLNGVWRRCSMLVWLIVWLFDKTPRFFKSFMIKMHFYFTGVPSIQIYIDSVIKYLSPSVVEKVLLMAYDELDVVREPDINLIKRNKKRIKIIHGYNDGWAPTKMFTEIQELIPELYIRKVPYEHAFVLNSYEQMADLTADLIPK